HHRRQRAVHQGSPATRHLRPRRQTDTDPADTGQLPHAHACEEPAVHSTPPVPPPQPPAENPQPTVPDPPHGRHPRTGQAHPLTTPSSTPPPNPQANRSEPDALSASTVALHIRSVASC